MRMINMFRKSLSVALIRYEMSPKRDNAQVNHAVSVFQSM